MHYIITLKTIEIWVFYTNIHIIKLLQANHTLKRENSYYLFSIIDKTSAYLNLYINFDEIVPIGCFLAKSLEDELKIFYYIIIRNECIWKYA